MKQNCKLLIFYSKQLINQLKKSINNQNNNHRTMLKNLYFLFLALLITPIISWFPKIVWTYWETGLTEDQHNMLVFHQHHKRILGDQWEIRFLNSTSIQYWLEQIPDLYKAFNSEELIARGPVKRSNFARFSLLSHFGGVYLDLTMILVENFDWLYNIKNLQYINNRYGEVPQVLLLCNQSYSKKSEYYDLQSKQMMHVLPSLEAYFIVSAPKSKFVVQLIQYYRQGILAQVQYDQNGKPKNYFLQQSLKNNYTLGHFGGTKYFQISYALMTIVNRKQNQFDTKWSGNQKDPRDLAVKYYKLWTLPTQISTYTFHYTNKYNLSFRMYPINIIMQSDINYLKRKQFFPKHFIKFAGGNRRKYIKYFLNESQKEKVRCSDESYILENSIGYQYLLKDYPVKFYENSLFKYSFQRNCKMPIQNLINDSRIYFRAIKKYELFIYAILALLVLQIFMIGSLVQEIRNSKYNLLSEVVQNQSMTQNNQVMDQNQSQNQDQEK